MGLSNRDRKMYLRMSRGKFRKLVPEGTPNAVEVEVRDDDGKVIRIKHELQWDSICGKVVGVSIVKNQESKWPDNLNIQMQDGEDHFIVQISVDSGLCSKLLNKFSNPDIDWSKQITINPYFFENENKSAVTVEQNGEKIPAYFTREEPRGMPQFEPGTFNDKGNVLDKKQFKIGILKIQSFLENYFFTNVKIEQDEMVQDDDGLPESEYIPEREQTKTKEDKTADTEETGDEESDLPF